MVVDVVKCLMYFATLCIRYSTLLFYCSEYPQTSSECTIPFHLNRNQLREGQNRTEQRRWKESKTDINLNDGL